MNRKPSRIRALILFIIFPVFLLALANDAGCAEVTSSMNRWMVVPDADGLFQAVGEVSIKNEEDETLNLKKVELKLVDAEGNQVGYSKRGKALLKKAMLVVFKDPSGNLYFDAFTRTKLRAGEEGIIFLEARCSSPAVPVSALMTITDNKKMTYSHTVPLDKFVPQDETVFPLPTDTGLYWIALNTSDVPVHRLALYYKDESESFVSQRFAVDFILVDEKGRSSIPRSSVNKEDYFAWEKEITCAAGGTVVAVVDGHPDMEIGRADEEHPGGNYVVVRHADGWYSFYAHLKEYSITVAEGQTVEKGQVIGLLGNSGNTTEPHLHMHFMDRWTGSGEVLSVYEAQGMPIPFWGISVMHKGKGAILPLEGAALREQDVVVAGE